VQWVENYVEKEQDQFLLLSRRRCFVLDPDQENVLRINFIGADLPAIANPFIG
jgi:hypothetical protein